MTRFLDALSGPGVAILFALLLIWVTLNWLSGCGDPSGQCILYPLSDAVPPPQG